MKRILVVLITLTCISVATSITYGYAKTTTDSLPFYGFGARANAMGGAFTAVADDGSAPYWNPAGITQLKIIALTADLGVTPDPEYVASWNMVGGLTTPGLAGNMFARISNAIDSNGFEIDKYRIDCTLTMATPLFVKWLAIGGNFKYVTTHFQLGDEYVDGAPIHRGVKTGFTYDLGLLIKPADYISFGFVGRDLGMTGIKWTESGAAINIYDSYAYGLAIKPTKSTIVAVDLDIVDSYKTLHLGLEQTAFWEFIALRAGMLKPLTNTNTAAQINVGMGLKFFGVYFDGALLDVNNHEKMTLEATAGFRH